MFELEEVNYDDTIPFIPPITHGKVIKVYNGDTITIATILPYENTLYRFSIKINGIDCPELKTKDRNEKPCALMAKNFILEKAMDKIVSLENIKTEKYGRLLADVICDGESLGELLLKARLAVPYDGKKKKLPQNWLKYYSFKENMESNNTTKPFYNKINFFTKIFKKKKKSY